MTYHLAGFPCAHLWRLYDLSYRPVGRVVRLCGTDVPGPPRSRRDRRWSREPLQEQPPRHRVQPLRGARPRRGPGPGPVQRDRRRDRPRDPGRGRPARPRGPRRVLRGQRPQPARLRPADRHRRRAGVVQEVLPRAGWTPSTGACRSPRSSAAPPPPRASTGRSPSWCSAPTPPFWMYGAGPGVRGRRAPQRQRARQADRPAHRRPRLGHHDGAHRARRRLRRRRRPHQGHAERRRHLEHRGRQALHHLRRVRPDREHHPPGAGPPGRRRGRRRPRHQGPVAVHRAEVPLRPRDRRADRRAQRRLRHQRRAQDGHQGLQHLRADLRRRTSPPGATCSARCTTASRRCSRSSRTPG